MRFRLLAVAAVTLTVGFSGSSQPRAGVPPIAFGPCIYTTTGADYGVSPTSAFAP
jgi:hypothetical protein